MAYHYTDESRESDPTALPDVEVFHHQHGTVEGIAVSRCEDPCCAPDGECGGSGWYYASGFPGCLWDSDPVGPFATEAEALEAARELVEE